MRSKYFGSWPSVHGLDRNAALRMIARRGSTRKDVRFREAIVDYRSLLTDAGGTTAGTNAFTGACLHRWADRWPNRTLRSITPTDIREYFADLAARGHAQGAVREEKGLLSSFYRWARRCGWAEEDPSQGLGAVRPFPDNPARSWTASEQRRLLDACRGSLASPPGRAGEATEPSPPYLYPLVLLGLRTGLHMGGILNLEWRHVDLGKERVVIPAHETRTGRPIDAPLHRDASAVLTALARKARDLSGSSRRVFEVVRIPIANGRPDEHKALAAFRKARRLAAIPEGDFGALRRSFIRNCASAGVPMEDAARMCDWDEPELLLETYEEPGAQEAASL
jgi:integrase